MTPGTQGICMTQNLYYSVYLAEDFQLGHMLILLHLWPRRHKRPSLSCCHPVNLHRYFAADDRDVGIRPYSANELQAAGVVTGSLAPELRGLAGAIHVQPELPRAAAPAGGRGAEAPRAGGTA